MLENNIVLVCDLVQSREGMNITTNNLEFTSPRYLSRISSSLGTLTDKLYVYKSPQEFMDNISIHKNDIVFTAVWSGVGSRNRKALLASVCEAYGIKYVGADAYVQSICQDKALSKLYCTQFDIKCPRGVLINSMSATDILHSLRYPVIVKPNSEGSSIGISDSSIAMSVSEARDRINDILSLFRPVLVEEYIDGIEVSICCVGSDGIIDLCEAVALEIDDQTYLHNFVWGFESKKGGQRHVTRKVITKAVPTLILDKAKQLFHQLGKVDYMRIDGRINGNEFYLIELTPDCSLHPDCFMVKAFEHNGYSYVDMLTTIIKATFRYS